MKRIQTKITLTYLILAVVIIAAVGIISSLEIESLFEDRLIHQLEQQADVVHHLLMNGRFPDERARAASIQSLADVLGARVTLIAGDGTVVADSDVPFEKLSGLENHLLRPEVQEALSKTIGVNIRRSATVGRDFLYVAKQYRDSVPSACDEQCPVHPRQRTYGRDEKERQRHPVEDRLGWGDYAYAHHRGKHFCLQKNFPPDGGHR